MKKAITATVMAAMLTTTGLAQAAATDAQKCEAGKNGAAGKYAACLHTAQQKFVKGGETDPDGWTEAVGKCALKFSDKWQSLEESAEGACRTNGDESAVQDYLDACLLGAQDALAGDPLPLDVATCNANLSTSNSSLTTCSANLSSTNVDLTTCSTNLATCGANLSSTNADLTGCNTNLSTTNVDLTACNAALSTSNSSLSACTTNLSATNADLTGCNADLSATNTDLTGCNTDLSATESDLTACEGDLAACEASLGCGDGLLDVGESCDVDEFGGATCATLGFAGGTLACAPGCTFDTSECYASRFDASGATIIDHLNGIEWEKKDSADNVANMANPHDVDNLYTWCDGPLFTDLCDDASNPMDGDAGAFLGHLNGTVTGTCYLGHCDWRLPTYDELVSILQPAPRPTPCTYAACVIDPIFYPTKDDVYFSGTTQSNIPARVRMVVFQQAFGTVGTSPKPNENALRAVRRIP